MKEKEEKDSSFVDFRALEMKFAYGGVSSKVTLTNIWVSCLLIMIN